MGMLRKLFPKRQAPGGASSTAATQLACAICSKEITGFHYSFESIMNGQLLGWQCPDCGQVFCQEHVVAASDATLCPECGGTLYSLEAGPAYSSMVEAGQRNGRYNAFIHAPDSSRAIKLG